MARLAEPLLVPRLEEHLSATVVLVQHRKIQRKEKTGQRLLKQKRPMSRTMVAPQPAYPASRPRPSSQGIFRTASFALFFLPKQRLMQMVRYRLECLHARTPATSFHRGPPSPSPPSGLKNPPTAPQTAVHDAYLEDIVHPHQIVGKRREYLPCQHVPTWQVFLDPKVRPLPPLACTKEPRRGEPWPCTRACSTACPCA